MVADFKKNKSKGLLRKIILVALGILMIISSVFLVFFNVKIYKKRIELKQKIEDLKKETESIKERNSYLKQGIEKSDSEQYIEKIAREELGLQKEGEKVVSFVASENQNKDKEPKQQNFWQSWLAWLANIFKE